MARDERKIQVITAALVIAGMGGFFLVLVMATGLPGLAGEFFSKVMGIITTPFLLEASVIIFGFILVILLNYWRQWREGDELVYLDEAKDLPKSSPESRTLGDL